MWVSVKFGELYQSIIYIIKNPFDVHLSHNMEMVRYDFVHPHAPFIVNLFPDKFSLAHPRLPEIF